MAVEVVGSEVEEDGALGREVGGVLELEARGLADHGRVGVDAPTSEASGVPTLPATATGSPRCGRGGRAARSSVVLPLVPVTATEAVRDQPPGELELAGDLDARARGPPAITGASWGTPGLLTTRSRHDRGAGSVHIQADFDARRLQPCRLRRACPNRPRTRLAALGEQLRDGGAGARQARRPGTGPSGSGGRGFSPGWVT